LVEVVEVVEWVVLLLARYKLILLQEVEVEVV
jgi:hypothetical protein